MTPPERNGAAHIASTALERKASAAFAAAVSAEPETKDVLLREAQRLAGQSTLAGAYAFLQKAVGLIAVTLPFVVAIGHAISSDEGMKGSISAHYYTHLGNYFVGALCALGVFFLSYNYRPLPDYRLDNILSNVAAAMAIGVALFPTAAEGELATGGASVIATLHLVFAGTLFVLLGVFSLFVFTKTDDPSAMSQQKRRRNTVFRVCGAIIFAAIVAVVASLAVQPPDSWHSLFWLESVAVVAFGVSWLVKGGFLGLLADRA